MMRSIKSSGGLARGRGVRESTRGIHNAIGEPTAILMNSTLT